MDLTKAYMAIHHIPSKGILWKYATVVYVISDEVLRILKVVDDPPSKMSNAEIITFVVVTAKFFSGNYKMARYLCKRIRLFSNILSNSRLNRRIHNIAWEYWHAIFRFISLIAKNEGPII